MLTGHPKGLYRLFFIEMWERLAFYTMLGILLLYTTDTERGGLGLSSGEGNEIYGLYLAFVYFTPFLGGMIADRFIGYRKSVLIGGILMAGGLFLMGVRGYSFFVTGLVALIVGNGLFKPNISVMVGNLYEAGDTKRDAGFNIFYMGINIGALVANFLAAWVRNEYGWLWTYWVAAAGLVIGLVILLWSWKPLEHADAKPEVDPEDTGFGEVFMKIIGPALLVGIGAYFLYDKMGWGDVLPLRPAVFGFLAGMIPVIFFFVNLGLKAKPDEKEGLLSLLPIYVAGGTFFMILHLNGSAMTQWARDSTDRYSPLPLPKQEALPRYYGNAAEAIPRPDPRTLLPTESEVHAMMFGQQRLDEAAVAALSALPGIEARTFESKVESETLSEADQAFFRRSANVFGADAEVKAKQEKDSHGVEVTTITIKDGAKIRNRVAFLREVDGKQIATFVVTQKAFDEIYDGYKKKYGKDPELLPPGEFLPVVNPEVYQSLNPWFVIIFTPLIVAFFAMMVRRKRGISTARKVFLGMVMTTFSLLLMAVAGFMSDNGAAKVSAIWLVGFYAIVTIGELCLSPMGLSLVTKLTPKRLVGLAMGGWFMATAFGNNLSGFFGGIQDKMEPAMFFLVLAAMSAAVALFIFLLLPKLDHAIKKYGA